MPDPNPNLDPALFTKDREPAYLEALVIASTDLVASTDTVERYERENSEEAQQARKREVEDTPEFKAVSDVVGRYMTELAISEIKPLGGTSVTEVDYTDAQARRAASQEQLCGLVFGYQEHMADNLRVVFDGDEAEVAESSWPVVWGRLKQALQPVGGTGLAEVADFFDDLVRAEYGSLYDPIDRLRGSVVAQDAAARSFYEVMEKHLSRAIVRSNEDGWTGYR